MFALNGSIPYGNEICGSHRSARPIFKVSVSLRCDSKFLGQEGDIYVCMREKTEMECIRFELLQSSLKYVTIKIETFTYRKISLVQKNNI